MAEACGTAQGELAQGMGGGKEPHLCKNRQDWAQGSMGEGHDHGGGSHDEQTLIVDQETPHAQHSSSDVFLHNVKHLQATPEHAPGQMFRAHV